MLRVFFSKQFKKDYKKIEKNKKLFLCLKKIILDLTNNKTLDKKYRNHHLKGSYKKYQECYIMPDLLLIYKIDDNCLLLYLFRTESHSNLFK